MSEPSTFESRLSAESHLVEWTRLGALRWLHGLDLSPVSSTFGVADREFWSWKTKDFANGTMQGGIAGLLDCADLLPFGPQELARLTAACVAGSKEIQRRDGSFEEAYPRESSFAVTALVAFDLAYARTQHPSAFGGEAQRDLDEVLGRACRFLSSTPETHGTISNHLATAAGALQLCSRLGLGTAKGASWSSVFATQDSAEGWLPEYGGADPGYQTLFNSYLSGCAVAGSTPSGAEEVLERSLSFLRWFCFADGTFAGEVGARGTAIVYPAGLWAWKDGRALPTDMWAWFLERHMRSLSAVTPVTADAGNFVPVFNSWARARRLHMISRDRAPAWQPGAEEMASRYFARGGLFVARTARAELAVSTRNGAMRRVVKESDCVWRDGSVVAHVARGRSTQAVPPIAVSVGATRLRLLLGTGRLRFPRHSPAATLALRVMAFLLSPFPACQRLLKRLLAWVAFRSDEKAREVELLIEAHLDDPLLTVVTESSSGGWREIGFGYHRHMASANTFDLRSLA